MSWIEWLDVTWALAVLDAVKPRHVQILLDPVLMEKNGLYLLK